MTNFQDRRHRTTTSVLSALAHVWLLIASADALIGARKCPDDTSKILASLSLSVVSGLYGFLSAPSYDVIDRASQAWY